MEAAKEQQIVEQTLRGGEETVQEEVEEDDAHGGCLDAVPSPEPRLLSPSLPDARSYRRRRRRRRNVGTSPPPHSPRTALSASPVGGDDERGASRQIHCGRACAFFHISEIAHHHHMSK